MSQKRFDFDAMERRQVAELWSPDEIFQDLTAELLPRFREDCRVEWKPAGIRAEALAVYICMYANTPPDGGVIVIGVNDDDGVVEGCSAQAESLTKQERKARNDLVPDATVEMKRILGNRRNGDPDFLVLLRVHYRTDKVVETNTGDSYIRRVDTKHLLNETEKRELQIERGQVPFELEQCSLPWPDAFDEAAARMWVSSVIRMKGLDLSIPVHQVLVNHKLGKMRQGNFVPNNACALLFAKDPQDVVPGCMLRFQRIEGVSVETGKDRNVVRDVRVTGTIPEIITQACAVLESQLRVYSRLGTDGKFYTAPEYPEEAWQEIIVNACVHRSYSLKGANIFVRMFDDKLVVESPGGFPATVSASNIYEMHYRRNWWLMDAMMYLDFVKCENEGAKRILAAMKEMALPDPKFEQKEIGGGMVRVTLSNNHNLRERWVDTDVSSVIGEEIASKLNDFEKRIVNFVAEHGQINISEAMQLMPRPRWHTARERLLGLSMKGILTHVSKFSRDPTAHFVLTEEAPD